MRRLRSKTCINKISKTLIMQVGSKILSFVINVLTARIVNKDLYGYANVTLQFYYAFILFFLKECVRKCLQKEVDMEKYTSKQRVRGALNIVTTCFGINVILAFATFWLTYTWYKIPGLDNTEFILSVFLYLFASIFETLCEPSVTIMLDKLEVDSKVFVEGTSLFLRGVILYLLLFLNLGLVAFGLAHMIYTLIMLALYLYKVSSLKLNKESYNLYTIEKVKLEKESVLYLDTHKSQLSQMSLIGFFRFILSEGENLVLNMTSNLTMEQQGEYSLIANLCSIICRFLFKPIEELAYNIFGKESLKDTHIEYMSMLLRHLFFLGIAIVSFTQNFAFSGLFVLYKEQWTNDSTVSILQAYGIYILCMAINGVTEAFVMAKSNKAQLQKLQITMMASSCLFILAMFLFIQAGPTGVVYANICNMICRIITNIVLIKSICTTQEDFNSLLKSSIPNPKVILVFIVTFIICYWSRMKYEGVNNFMHLAIGALNAGLCLLAHILCEFDWRKYLKR